MAPAHSAPALRLLEARTSGDIFTPPGPARSAGRPSARRRAAALHGWGTTLREDTVRERRWGSRRHVREESLGRKLAEIQVGMMLLERAPRLLEAQTFAPAAGLVRGLHDVGADVSIGRLVVHLRGRGVTSGSGAFLRLAGA